MSWGDLSALNAGVGTEVKRLLEERIAAELRAQQAKQQEFNNQRLLRADERAQQTLDAQIEGNRLSREFQQNQFKATEMERQRTNVEQDRERRTPYQLMFDADPKQGAALQQYDRFNIETGIEIPKMQPRLYTSATDKVGTASAPTNERAAVYMTPTFAQEDKLEGRRLQERTAQRAEDALVETSRRNAAMEAIATANSGKQGGVWVQRNGKTMRVREDEVLPTDERPSNADTTSYNTHTRLIDNVAKPITDRAERLQRLLDTLEQNNGIADSLVAPAVITAIDGGFGSGLRVTEAEIKRVIGGRSTLDDIRAAALKVQNGQSITPEQRRNLNALIRDVKSRVDKKAQAVQRARRALAGSTDADQHRQIYVDLQESLYGADEDTTTQGAESSESTTTKTKRYNPATGRAE